MHVLGKLLKITVIQKEGNLNLLAFVIKDMKGKNLFHLLMESENCETKIVCDAGCLECLSKSARSCTICSDSYSLIKTNDVGYCKILLNHYCSVNCEECSGLNYYLYKLIKMIKNKIA